MCLDGAGLRLECRSTRPSSPSLRCDAAPPETPPTRATDSFHQQQHNNLLLQLALIVSVCVLAAVVINVAISLLLQRTCSRRKLNQHQPPANSDVSSGPAEQIERRPLRATDNISDPREDVTSPMNRQLTVLSHGYEEIVDEEEGESRSIARREPPLNETGEFSVQDLSSSQPLYGVYEKRTGSEAPRNAGAEYIPMHASAHPYFLYDRSSTHDVARESQSLDSIVLPPNRQSLCSTAYNDPRRSQLLPPARQRDSQVYSYAFGSRDGVHLIMPQQQQWPRKFSAESLDSAAELLRRNPQLQSGFLRSLGLADANRNSSFDSGYADRSATQRSFDIFDSKPRPQTTHTCETDNQTGSNGCYIAHDAMFTLAADGACDEFQSKQASGNTEKTTDCQDNTPDYENIFDDGDVTNTNKSEEEAKEPLVRKSNSDEQSSLGVRTSQPAPGSPGYIELLPQ